MCGDRGEEGDERVKGGYGKRKRGLEEREREREREIEREKGRE